MSWQDIAVAGIVAAALTFLARKVLGLKRATRDPQAFIPLTKVGNRGRRDRACH